VKAGAEAPEAEEVSAAAEEADEAAAAAANFRPAV